MQKKTRKQYSAEFKAKVVREILKEEKTVGQLAAEYGVHSNMLLRGGWMYLVAILDWYSRYVVSWELDQTMQIAFVLEAMQRALAQAKSQICNSDQGREPVYEPTIHPIAALS